MPAVENHVDDPTSVHPSSAARTDPTRVDDAAFLVWRELEEWSAALAPWQQWIVAHAVDHRTLSPAELDAAYVLLLRYTQLGASDGDPVLPAPPINTRPTSAPPSRWLLREIRDLQNVNAIPKAARLPIGPGITVVYGKNGAGKSGFARLLSNSCFSRAPSEILPNVYTRGVGVPDAVIMLTGPDGDEEVAIAATPNHAGLRSFTVFDAQAARVQLSEENVLAFTPTGMDVFREVSRVYTVISDRLKTDIESRSIRFDFVTRLGSNAEATSAAAEVSAIRSRLDLTPIQTLVAAAPEDRQQLDALRKKMAELALIQSGVPPALPGRQPPFDISRG